MRRRRDVEGPVYPGPHDGAVFATLSGLGPCDAGP